MVATITNSFVQQFSANIHDLLEQKGSKLMGKVDIENVVGNKAFFETIGSLEVAKVTDRHADTTLSDPAHNRRMLLIEDYAGAVMLDHQDNIKMLIDPANNYAKKLANGLGRTIDDIIITAMLGSASAGESGGSSVALPAGQKIATGGTGLTMAKLIEAKKIFVENEYNESLTLAITGKGLEDLLSDEKATSGDYQSILALVRGEIGSIMGMHVVINNRIPLNGSDKVAIVFAPEAVKFGKASDMKLDMDKRADKNNNLQVLVRGSYGAVRMEEKLVVEISHTA